MSSGRRWKPGHCSASRPTRGPSARTVNSSADRIEAFVADTKELEDGLLLVNGLPCEFYTAIGGVPSEASAKEGRPAAAGIRYRAFSLTPSLQPHVPVHAPLLLEWVDRKTFGVFAAARWHVWNPRSAQYRDRPADDAAAAAPSAGSRGRTRSASCVSCRR